MKSTLLLRLCGPMQSWGTQSRFIYRDTEREPSKSGVIGLLCAALGKPRVEVAGDGKPTLAQLAGLRMGVRADREGNLECDYQTAENVAEAHGKGRRTVQSWRSYLADADFLVGLEGDRRLLEKLDRALASPVWHLFLGRKSLVPAIPVRLPNQPPWGPGLSDEVLETALRAIPWHGRPGELPPAQLRFIVEDTSGASAEVRNDVPRSFDVRAFAPRGVSTQFVDFKEVAGPCGSLV
jgi:CRISPR system Cascade subunit CasD